MLTSFPLEVLVFLLDLCVPDWSALTKEDMVLVARLLCTCTLFRTAMHKVLMVKRTLGFRDTVEFTDEMVDWFTQLPLVRVGKLDIPRHLWRIERRHADRIALAFAGTLLSYPVGFIHGGETLGAQLTFISAATALANMTIGFMHEREFVQVCAARSGLPPLRKLRVIVPTLSGELGGMLRAESTELFCREVETVAPIAVAMQGYSPASVTWEFVFWELPASLVDTVSSVVCPRLDLLVRNVGCVNGEATIPLPTVVRPHVKELVVRADNSGQGSVVRYNARIVSISDFLRAVAACFPALETLTIHNIHPLPKVLPEVSGDDVAPLLSLAAFVRLDIDTFSLTWDCVEKLKGKGV